MGVLVTWWLGDPLAAAAAPLVGALFLALLAGGLFALLLVAFFALIVALQIFDKEMDGWID